MIIAAGRLRLPFLDKDILGHVAASFEDPSLDDDTLTRDIRTGDVAAEIVLEDFEAGLVRNQADMNVRSRCLRRGLWQVGNFKWGRHYLSFPAACFRTRFGGALATRYQSDRRDTPAGEMR